MAQVFKMPKHVVYGENALEKAMPFLKNQGQKALIITDKLMLKLNNVSVLTKVLDTLKIAYVIYDDVDSEPTDIMVDKGAKLYLQTQCDFLISMGGGSVIDTMKAIALKVVSFCSLDTLMGKEIDVDTAFMVAIPTTAGTGSEATKFTIITDTKKEVKMLLKGDCLMPSLAIIDPLFTLSCPLNVTINTGIDALCHSIEAYISKKHQALADTFALKAMNRIFKYLPKLANNLNDLEARKQMALASFEAGVAFNNSSVTIVHGMSRPIGALFHLPHGLSNAILLNSCMRFVADGSYHRFKDIAYSLGFKGDAKEATNHFLAYLDTFIKQFKLPTLNSLGIEKEVFFQAIDKMSDDALISGSPYNNTKEITKDDLIRLYQSLY